MSLPVQTAPPADDRADEIDLAAVFRPLRRRWKRFVIVALVTTAAAAAGLLQLKPTFRSTGSIYLESDTSAASSAAGESLSRLLPGMGADADIESQKEIIASDRLALRIIGRLGLSTELSADSAADAASLPEQPSVWQWRLRPDVDRFTRGVHVRELTIHTDKPMLSRTVNVRFTGEGDFTIHAASDASSTSTENATTPLATGQLNQPVTLNDVTFTLTANDNVSPAAGSSLLLTLRPPHAALEAFREQLQVSGGGAPPRSNHVIDVTFEADSPVRSAAVVRMLIDDYVALRHEWATSQSRATMAFVSEQIERLREDMNQATQQLATYQAEAGVINLDASAEAELKQLVDFEVRLTETSIRLKDLEQLATALDSGNPDLYLLAFVEDPLIQSMGESLSQLNVDIASMTSRFSDDYRPLAQKRIQREELARTLKASLDGYLVRAREQKAEVARTVADQRARLMKLPEANRLLTEHLRAARVFENLYVFLFHELQRSKIAVASTLSNIRVYDPPQVHIKPVAPTLRMLLLASIACGLAAAGLLVWVPALRVRWFQSLEEVEAMCATPACAAATFAVIPSRTRKAKRGTPGILDDDPRSPFLESIRLLRTNLLQSMAGRESQSVLLTSAMAGDGKTSVSANLALTLARSGRSPRVLIIDADLHHPALHGVFRIPQSPGLSNYLNGEASRDDVLHTMDLGAGQSVDVITAGPSPITPADLMETPTMQDLLAWARQQYAFVLLDAPPYPLVASAAVLAPSVDRLLSICRVGQTDRSVFRHHLAALRRINPRVGLIVNVPHRTADVYGYGARYGEAYAHAAGETTQPAPTLRERSNTDADANAATTPTAASPTSQTSPVRKSADDRPAMPNATDDEDIAGLTEPAAGRRR